MDHYKHLAVLFLIFAVNIPASHQELAGGLHRRMPGSEVPNDSARLQTFTQHGSVGLSKELGNVAMDTQRNNNASAEMVAESLARLEGNLDNLMQSFLAMQRSVFNLEQLQELLVLLLEDILKQTGNMNSVSNRDQPRNSMNNDSGGISESRTESNDSSDENDDAYDDDIDNETRLQNGNTPTGANKPEGVENGRIAGNSQHSEMFPAREAIGVNSNAFHRWHTREAVLEKQGVVPPMVDEDSGDSTTSASASSGSWENTSGQMPVTAQGATQQGDTTFLRPLWSEPLTSHTSNSIRSRFQDVFRHIMARQGQPGSHLSDVGQRLGMLQTSQRSQSNRPESTLERPPAFEPLEVVTSQDSVALKGKELQTQSEVLTFDVKLGYDSPVVSHVGPGIGPEPNSSPFLERLGDHHRNESPGERATGMINNLVQQADKQIDANLDTTTGPAHVTLETPPTSTSAVQASISDVRRRRQTAAASTAGKPPTVGMTMSGVETDRAKVVIKLRPAHDKNHNQTVTPTLKVTTLDVDLKTLPSSHTISSVDPADNSVDPTLLIFPDPTFTDSNYSTSKTTPVESKQQISENATVAEYDFLIAALLKDLSRKLHQYHTNNQDRGETASNGVISKVVSELNKAIWIPFDDVTFPPPTVNITHAVKSTAHMTATTSDSTTMANIKTWATETEDAMTVGTGHWVTTPPSQTTTKRTSMKNKTTNTNDSNKDIDVNVRPHVSSRSGHYNHKNIPEREINVSVTASSNSDLSRKIDIEHQDTIAPTSFLTKIQGNTTKDTASGKAASWEWLGHLTTQAATYFNVDRTWLIETLNQLSQLEDLAQNMRMLSDKGLSLVQRRQHFINHHHEIDEETESADDLNDTGNAENAQQDNEGDDSQDDIDEFLNPEKLDLDTEGQGNKGANFETTITDEDKQLQENNRYDEKTIFRDLQDRTWTSNDDINFDSGQGQHDDYNDQDYISHSFSDSVTQTDSDEFETASNASIQDNNSAFGSKVNSFQKDIEDQGNYDESNASANDDAADSDDSDNDSENHDDTDYGEEDIDNMDEGSFLRKIPDDKPNLIDHDTSTMVDKTNTVHRKQDYMSSGEDIDHYIVRNKDNSADVSAENNDNGNTDTRTMTDTLTLSTGRESPRYSDHHHLTRKTRSGSDSGAINDGQSRKHRGKHVKRKRRQVGSLWNQLFNPSPPVYQTPPQRRANPPSMQSSGYQLTQNGKLFQRNMSRSRQNPQTASLYPHNHHLQMNRAFSSNPSQKPMYTNSDSQYSPYRPHLNPTNRQTHLNPTNQQAPHHSRGSSLGGVHHAPPSHHDPASRSQQPFVSEYPNYLNFLGLPAWAFAGFARPEPGEGPSMNLGAPLEFEEILNNLFQRYWQRVNNLYPRPITPTTTTIDPDYEAEMTTITTTAMPSSRAAAEVTSISVPKTSSATSTPGSISAISTSALPDTLATAKNALEQGTQSSASQGPSDQLDNISKSTVNPQVPMLQPAKPTTIL